MGKKYSYKEIAENVELWEEYVDPGATMSREDFDNMTTKERVALQIEIFGPDEKAE